MSMRLSDQGKNQAHGKLTANAQRMKSAGTCLSSLLLDSILQRIPCRALLPCSQEWQEWLNEELDFVLGEASISDSLDYNTIFPQLSRCLVVMVRNIAMLELDPETI